MKIGNDREACVPLVREKNRKVENEKNLKSILVGKKKWANNKRYGRVKKYKG